MQAAHERDFADFDIEFDNYGSTHSPENRALCGEFWTSLRKAGLVKEKDVEQLYDPEAEHVPRRPLRPRHLPQVQVARPVRRQLQQVRPPLQPDRSDRSA